jgi:hypothetical protein
MGFRDQCYTEICAAGLGGLYVFDTGVRIPKRVTMRHWRCTNRILKGT